MYVGIRVCVRVYMICTDLDIYTINYTTGIGIEDELVSQIKILIFIIIIIMMCY